MTLASTWFTTGLMLGRGSLSKMEVRMDLTSITILSQQPRLIGNSDKMSSIMRQQSERLIGSSMVKIVLS
jgi:hypothetical protein